MRYANVVLDIPTRSLDGAFCYAVPMGLGSVVVVGTTVLVPFSHRDVVGYVVGITDRPADGVDPDRVLPVRQVLADAAFDEVAAGVAAWIAHEYACPLCDAVRPFLAPGQKVRVVRASADSPWELVSEKAGPVDVRWASLTEAGASFEPARNASRQREVVEALRRGPQRVAELAAMTRTRRVPFSRPWGASPWRAGSMAPSRSKGRPRSLRPGWWRRWTFCPPTLRPSAWLPSWLLAPGRRCSRSGRGEAPRPCSCSRGPPWQPTASGRCSTARSRSPTHPIPSRLAWAPREASSSSTTWALPTPTPRPTSCLTSRSRWAPAPRSASWAPRARASPRSSSSSRASMTSPRAPSSSMGSTCAACPR